ncbi:MAG: HAMP domain-containing sensor histidine kinase [Acidimicrobiales bacterium]
MRRRLTASILAVAILALVLFGVPLVIVVQRFVDEQAALRLERQAVLASRQVPIDFASASDPVELPAADGVTFGLYDRRGVRIGGKGPERADALVAAALTNEVRQGEQGETRVAAIPIVDHETVVGVVRASQPTTVADGRARRATTFLGLLGAAVVVLGAVLARLVAGRLVRPVRQLRDQAVRLGNGDFGIERVRTGVSELDEAGSALAVTATRIEDLLARERAFSADASHQLRTPLAALRTNIETELHFPRPTGEVVLTEALEDIARLEATIDQLLDFARTSTVPDATFAVSPFLDRLRADWNGTLARRGRPLVVTWPQERLEVVGTEALIRQAFDTILDNAVRHGAGEVRLSVRTTDESATVTVTDKGPGFPDATEAPERSSSSPHGYGLALARRIIEASRGRLVIADRGPNPIIEVVLRRGPGPAET